jgi:quercetin dioxygenase-like cupin family protein
MKRLLVSAVVVVMAVVALGMWASIARTQTKVLISTDGSDAAKWDKNLDGPIAAPGNHKVIFENDNIRVQSVTVPPNTEEPYHLHPYYSVLIVDSLPQNTVDRDIKGNALKEHVSMAVTKTFPLVTLQPPNALHSVKNNDPKRPEHLVRIESKHTIPQLVSFPATGPIESQGTLPISTDGSDPSKWNPKKASAIAAPGNHKIIFENDNLRVISVTVPAGSTEPLHDHPYYSFLFVDSDARVADHDATGKTLPSATPKVPFGFLQPPQALHAVQDLDNQKDMHLIRIEFKKGFKQL